MIKDYVLRPRSTYLIETFSKLIISRKHPVLQLKISKLVKMQLLKSNFVDVNSKLHNTQNPKILYHENQIKHVDIKRKYAFLLNK